MKRMTAIIMLALLTAATLTGCDMVKAGAKCKAGSPAGRDANFVLFCTNGRWKRTLTIQQAANFILGTIPGKVAPVSTGPTTVKAGDQLGLAVGFKVTSRTGTPLAKAKLTLNAPATGAGLDPSSELTATSGDDGVAWFPRAVINNALGSFELTARIDGTEFSTTSTVNVVAGPATAITIVSGQGQTVAAGTDLGAMAVRVTDRLGNPASGTVVDVYTGSLSPSKILTTGADGMASTGTGMPVSAPTTAGALTVTMQIDRTSINTQFHHTIVANNPGYLTVEGPSPFIAAHNAAFTDPLTVQVTDYFHNPVVGLTVTFTAPGSGATAVLSAPSAVTGSDGRASVTATAGSVTGDYQVAVAAGSLTSGFGMRNT